MGRVVLAFLKAIHATFHSLTMADDDGPHTPPKRHSYINRDQRRDCQTLRAIGWSYKNIANHCQITERQVQYACTHPATPTKRSGRPTEVDPDIDASLMDLVTKDKHGRRMSYFQVGMRLGLSEHQVRHRLRRLGFKRYIALRKPPISERNRVARYAWAQEHRRWTKEQWNQILWSDETWITGGRHTRTWVTRRNDEALHEDCIVFRLPKKSGWMFWGCFSGGLGKGLSLFWEKD